MIEGGLQRPWRLSKISPGAGKASSARRHAPSVTPFGTNATVTPSSATSCQGDVRTHITYTYISTYAHEAVAALVVEEDHLLELDPCRLGEARQVLFPAARAARMVRTVRRGRGAARADLRRLVALADLLQLHHVLDAHAAADGPHLELAHALLRPLGLVGARRDRRDGALPPCVRPELVQDVAHCAEEAYALPVSVV
eukprot:scaffold14168_cov64-Phaeocystis_antarctica.AAC.12